MAVHIVCAWEMGWNTPIKEIDLWEFALKEFAVDGFHMSPVSGVFNTFVTEHTSVEPLLAEFRQQGYTIVFVDETAATPLPDFVHPENAVYVLGKSSLSMYAAYHLEGDPSVVIPTVTNQGGFWPHQAASIVLYDRMLKG